MVHACLRATINALPATLCVAGFVVSELTAYRVTGMSIATVGMLGLIVKYRREIGL